MPAPGEAETCLEPALSWHGAQVHTVPGGQCQHHAWPKAKSEGQRTSFYHPGCAVSSLHSCASTLAKGPDPQGGGSYQEGSGRSWR